MYISHLSKRAQKRLIGTGVVVSSAFASVNLMAADHSTAIAAASADGVTNLGASVTGILTVVAVIVGVGLVIKFLQRS